MSRVKPTSKGGAISITFVTVILIVVIAFAVNEVTLPTGNYSTGAYDTMQISNVGGQTFTYGGTLNAYSATISPNQPVFNSSDANVEGVITDTLNFALAINNGTTEGFSTTCSLSATLNGTTVKSITCPTQTTEGVVGTVISPTALTITGQDLQDRMNPEFINETGDLQFSFTGTLTIYFLQGCSSPPCGETHTYQTTQLSTVYLMDDNSTIGVSMVQGGPYNSGITSSGNEQLGGVGLNFCNPGAKC